MLNTKKRVTRRTVTKLETNQFLPNSGQAFRALLPYRNSNSVKEGLTIPLKEFRRMGVTADKLFIGSRFKLAIKVDGLEQLPLVQGHINSRGGYITAKVADYHESQNHLPAERIKMGDRRKGSNYQIMVAEILWEPVVEEEDPFAEIVAVDEDDYYDHETNMDDL